MADLPRIKLVVFDWAGTTVDFGCCGPAVAFLEAFAEAGVPVSAAEARAPMGLAKKEHIRVMLAAPALAERWRSIKGRPATEADVEVLYHAVTPRQVEAAGRLGAPVPGLLECVNRLRADGIKVAGTTGYFRAAAEAAARTAAAAGYVPDANACADDVPAGRPAPWMMFRVMEAAGVFPGAAVVKVGDTPVDMGEGRSAGAWCVGVLDSSNIIGLTAAEFDRLTAKQRQDLRTRAAAVMKEAGAHETIATLNDLPAAIESFNRRTMGLT